MFTWPDNPDTVRRIPAGATRRRSRVPGDTLLEYFGKSFTDFHHGGALAGNKVMVMAILILHEQFKARGAVFKIEALHHRCFFEQTQRSIIRGEIAIEFPVDLARGQIGKVLPWMSVRRH